MVTSRLEHASEQTRRLKSIGKYQLVAQLGKGGMATVYLALVAGPGGFNKLMVVKVLRDDLLGGSDEGVQMFWKEARLSAQLVHPNIVHTFEVGQIDEHYFLAMEYLEGQTLRAVQTRAQSRGGIPVPESLRILADVARGLHYSHELKSFKGEPLGVVHRDVSPQNVMVTYDGQVKVLDFGIAKIRNSDHQTQAGMIKGKLEYVAPEQLRGEALDGRADVFSLGAMLWEALTRERFAGGHAVADVAKVHTRLSGGERKLRDLVPDVPEALAKIVDAAIAVSPSARFESAAAFADALDGYLATLPTRPSATTLAQFLAPMFATERARMHELIDEQIERSTESGSLITLGADPLSASGVVLQTPPAAPRVSVPEPVRRVARRRKPWLAAISATAVVAGATLALLSARTPPDPVLPEPQVASAGAAPLAPVAMAVAAAPTPAVPTRDESTARSVRVDLKVTPAHAEVTLDGAPLAMPFRGRFLKSEAMHMIEASADGYRPFKRLVPLDTDQTLAIVLEPAPRPAPARKPARAPVAERARPEPATAPSSAQAPPPQPIKREPAPGERMTSEGSGIRGRLLVDDPYAKP